MARPTAAWVISLTNISALFQPPPNSLLHASSARTAFSWRLSDSQPSSMGLSPAYVAIEYHHLLQSLTQPAKFVHSCNHGPIVYHWRLVWWYSPLACVINSCFGKCWIRQGLSFGHRPSASSSGFPNYIRPSGCCQYMSNPLCLLERLRDILRSLYLFQLTASRRVWAFAGDQPLGANSCPLSSSILG